MTNNHTYECMLVLDNREVKQGWDALKASVHELFEKHGAEVVSSEVWDERRLAYPIRHHSRGTYLLAYVKSDTEKVTAIRRELQFSDSVFRNQIIAVEEVPEEKFASDAEFNPETVLVDDKPDPEPEPEVEAAEGEEKTEAKAEAGDGEAAEGEGEGEGEGETETETKAEGSEEAAAGDSETKEEPQS